MFSILRNKLRRHILNYRGWTTSRKIVVIESDDWGSIRMPSKQVYKKMLEAGIRVDKSPYCRFDTLATTEDLEALFNTLSKFKDSQNNPPVITANALMANPDFDKIESSGFNDYYYENFTETLNRYPGCSGSYRLWMQGLDNGIFFPQFHGREHINVPLWLKLLKQNHRLLKIAFDHKFWGLSNEILSDLKHSIQAAYDSKDESALSFQNQSIIEGLNLFEEIFGYRSKSFIASNYIWDPALENKLQQSGIRYIQGMKYQICPRNNSNNRDFIRHYIGEKNRFGQRYLVRNCVFEPSLNNKNKDNVGDCLKDISNAFFWKKPAVVACHRLNFIGALEIKNRRSNLKALSKLLKKIIQNWPEVEFFTSDKLGKLINCDL